MRRWILETQAVTTKFSLNNRSLIKGLDRKMNLRSILMRTMESTIWVILIRTVNSSMIIQMIINYLAKRKERKLILTWKTFQSKTSWIWLQPRIRTKDSMAGSISILYLTRTTWAVIVVTSQNTKRKREKPEGSLSRLSLPIKILLLKWISKTRMTRIWVMSNQSLNLMISTSSKISTEFPICSLRLRTISSTRRLVRSREKLTRNQKKIRLIKWDTIS